MLKDKKATKIFIGYLLSHNTENETMTDDQFLIILKKENKVMKFLFAS